MNLKPPKNSYSFLVDVNLPKRFKFFNEKNFTHVVDIDACMKDNEIWDYAIEHNMIILTKDADFYNKFTSSSINPKVIYFQLGNLTLAELHHYFELNWWTILNHLEEGSYLVARIKSIDVIS